MLAVDAGVDDTDPYLAPARLDRTSLRRVDHLHAPLLRLERVAAGGADRVRLDDLQRAAGNSRRVTRVLRPAEVEPNRVDDGVLGHRLREGGVLRVDDHHAELARQ